MARRRTKNKPKRRSYRRSSSMGAVAGNLLTTIGGIASQQLKSNIYGLVEFDGIRVGLEDNLMFRKGEKATNSELLKRVHRIMTELDLDVMSSNEFRKLGYENRKTNNR